MTVTTSPVTTSPVTTSHSTRQDAERRQLAEQLEAVRARLIDDYGRDRQSVDMVDRLFEHAANRFEDARIRTFVPILVERAVRIEFTHRPAVPDVVTA